jgi:uncharacterized protein YdeI (YjbR/CyaY-like superfamily)
MKVIFFKSPAAFGAWLETHHGTELELWVGFHKKATGKPSLTWPESVDEALCVGWIDGLRKNVDETSYKIRFTPRKRRSIWSAINIRRVEHLTKQGLMRPAGLTAFEARHENRSGIYSYEQRSHTLPDPYAPQLKKNRKAEKFFNAQPASYRKAASWWVVSAKKEDTRLKRLGALIEHSAAGRRLPQYTTWNKRKTAAAR